MNQATIIGRVGQDPEIRKLNNGDSVANLSIATSERWRDKSTGERREKTEWHRVTVWGNLVKVVENYVQKGDQIMVQGKIQTRKYQGQDGSDRFTTEIVVENFGGTIELLGGKREGGDDRSSRDEGGPRQQPAPADGFDLDDDIPF